MTSNLPVVETRQRHFLPVALLFILAPLFGEYLLGNLKLSEIVYLPFIAPLYGAGAVIIREVTRRAGRGPATMLILGIAYGLIEEGLVDQMLFNQFYFRGQDQITDTFIQALGLDAWLTLIVLAMHAVWSTYIPITLVESIFPQWESTPWLDTIGLRITAAIFIVGSIYLGYIIYLEENFFASIPQLIGTTIVVILLVRIAFVDWRSGRVPVPGFVPNPWLAAGVSFVTSSLFMLTESLPGWTKVGACLLLVIIFFATVAIWSGHIGWSGMHRLALVGGGILTYVWLGILMEPDSGPKTSFDHLGSVFLALVAITLLAFAAKKLQNFERTPVTGNKQS